MPGNAAYAHIETDELTDLETDELTDSDTVTTPSPTAPTGQSCGAFVIHERRHTMATWLSGAKRQSWGRDGGSFTTNPDKILLHSTETGSFPGYGGGASAPHFTIDLENGEVRQHSPMNRAARALRNASGGVQTNRDGVIQIEIIGTCDKSFARKHGYPYLPDMTDEMAGRLKWLLQKICAAIPAIPLTTSVAWKSYPSSYGNSSVRMSNSQWTRYKGILGHQHAPENTHGDPGDLPMKRILGADAVKCGRIIRWRVRLHRRRPGCPARPVRQRR